MEPAQTMTKLARGRRLFSLVTADSQTLWLAGDCLLLQSATGYTERVRRFYFADIQSIVYARTNAGTVITVLCSVAAALLAFLGFWAVSDMGMTGGLLIAALALFPLAGLVFNIVAGPTCACMLSTAVHRERILALNRIPKVERVIGQILPLIDAAQGRLTAEMLGVDQPEADSVAAGRHAADGSAGRVPLRHEPGTFHRIAFMLCLAFALSLALDISMRNITEDLNYVLVSGLKGLLDFALLSVLAVCVIIAVVKQRNSFLPNGVKGLCYAMLVLLPVYFVAGMFLKLFIGMAAMESGASIPLAFAERSLTFLAFQILSAMTFMLVGAFGWMRLGRTGAAARSFREGGAAPSPTRDESL
jgi:hypothetical protein